jgi:hypothetical protein
MVPAADLVSTIAAPMAAQPNACNSLTGALDDDVPPRVSYSLIVSTSTLA